MDKIYDVAICGCGPAGLFASYKLAKADQGLKILIIDQGNDFGIGFYELCIFYVLFDGY